ncbi:MAG: DNA polymerase IV [Candidatus Omnitrophota bacterium]
MQIPTIAHVDMDAFFAAVEQRDTPCLRGKPVVIGADPKKGKGRGVVSTCSYEAREFGIYSSMPISVAYQKCPTAAFLPVNMSKYDKESERIQNIFYQFTPLVEEVSIDEAFLDITGSLELFGNANQLCSLLKEKIKKETGLTASVGCAPNKMAAKIASDIDKPDGLTIVYKGDLVDFLRPLGIERISGLGKKSRLILNNLGIVTIGQLRQVQPEELEKLFGKRGRFFWEMANGTDYRKVEVRDAVKSLSKEITFQGDTEDKEALKQALVFLCETVSLRLRQKSLKAGVITLKVRLEDFSNHTKLQTLIKASSFVDVIYESAQEILKKINLKGKKVRLIGINVSALVSEDFQDSFLKEPRDDKLEKIHQALDKIKIEFGSRAIGRAASIEFTKSGENSFL